MSTAYYYFAATLGVLEFGMPAPQTCEAFLEDCWRLLSEQDARDVRIVLEGGQEGFSNQIIKEWLFFENQLANHAAWLRASNMGKDPSVHIRGEYVEDPFIMDVLVYAQESFNPLEAEKVIAKAKWEKIDDMISGHFFDFEIIAAYAIKLKILERFAVLGSDKGKEVFNTYKNEALSVGQTVEV